MVTHLFKLIWNRKRENALLIVELIAAFLVVFFIAATAAHTWTLYRQPLGFDYRDSWEMRLSFRHEWAAEDAETLRQLLSAVRGHPAVEWAHVVRMGPFRNWQWTSEVAHDGSQAPTMLNDMSDGAPDDFGMELLQGRWFGPQDIGVEEHVVVINERLSQELFGDASPLGADIRNYNPDSDEVQLPYRVVGVFRDFRQMGPMAELSNYVLGRFELEEEDSEARTIILRMRDGAPAAVEEELQAMAEAIARRWSLALTPLEQLRRQQIRQVTTPLMVGGFVAGFLLLMVAFGLFGVLWQNVTRRTDELGLRRAVGASRRRIYRQIVTEIVLVAALAMAAGAAIGVQFPMLGTFETLDWRSSVQALIIGSVLVCGLCVLCALYPAWLASRRSPADALHYE